MPKASAPPVSAMRNARFCCPAPMFVPTRPRGRAEAKHQWDEQVLKPSAGAVACHRVGPASDRYDRGGERDGERRPVSFGRRRLCRENRYAASTAAVSTRQKTATPSMRTVPSATSTNPGQFAFMPNPREGLLGSKVSLGSAE